MRAIINTKNIFKKKQNIVSVGKDVEKLEAWNNYNGDVIV